MASMPGGEAMLVGIDLGGTEIKAGLVDREGRILLQSSIPTNAGRDYRLIIKDMQMQVEKLLKDYGADTGDMESIGIGAPGLMNEKSGYVIYCTNLSGRMYLWVLCLRSISTSLYIWGMMLMPPLWLKVFSAQQRVLKTLC